MRLVLGDLQKIWGNPIGRDHFNLKSSICSVHTDSREVEKGSLFIPLIGKRFDGHKFLEQAFKKGAQAVIVSEKNRDKVPVGFLHWIVPDTLKAYQELALLHRSSLNIPVIAVTGSVGKTTTRELIRSVLSPIGSVVSSEGNDNNDVGVPKTLLVANESDDAVVLEMGMRGLGEIQRLSCCAKPDIAVITNIGSAHLGRLGSRRNIAKAKCEITTCLKPNGVVVIPYGDSLLEEMLRKCWGGRVVRVALNYDSLEQKQYSKRAYYEDFDLEPDFYGQLNLNTNTMLVEGKVWQLPLEGKHNAKNFMLALAVAKELGIVFEDIRNLKVNLPFGRNRFIQYGPLMILDETYNASPESVEASLELLVRKPGRHFVVLGEMLELGSESLALHAQVVERALRLGVDGMVIVANGEEAKVMKKAADPLNRLAVVSTPEDALAPLLLWLKPGDVLLLKASRAVELEKLLPLLGKEFP